MEPENRRRHEAFWRHEAMDRPLFGINLGFFVQQRFPRVLAHMPQGIIGPDDIPVDLFLDDCDDLYESHREMGDYPFVAAPFVGIPWLEAIAGCPIIASPANLWAEPCANDLSAWQAPQNVRENPWTQMLLELLRALVKRSRGRYGAAPTLMRGPLDIVSALGGAAKCPLAFLDQPESIVRVLESCAAIWAEVAKLQLELIPESQEGYVAGDAALRCWAPDKLLWLQEDAMSLLSPRLYRQYVLPIDRKLSEMFPCVVYHLHGSALWAIDDLIGLPGVRVIELNLEAAACDVEGTWAGWKRIQEHKPVILWRTYGDDFLPWLERVRREFSSVGLSIQVSTNNLAEADKVKAGWFEYEDHQNRDV